MVRWVTPGTCPVPRNSGFYPKEETGKQPSGEKTVKGIHVEAKPVCAETVGNPLKLGMDEYGRLAVPRVRV